MEKNNMKIYRITLQDYLGDRIFAYCSSIKEALKVFKKCFYECKKCRDGEMTLEDAWDWFGGSCVEIDIPSSDWEHDIGGYINIDKLINKGK